MNKKFLFASFFITLISFVSAQVTAAPDLYKIFSPDKLTTMEVRVNEKGTLQYLTAFEGKTVIDWSELGLDVDHSVDGTRVNILGINRAKHNEKIPWVLGENDVIDNTYNEMTVDFLSGNLRIKLIARLFNGSIAFRYMIPEQQGLADLKIKKEKTFFNFTRPYKIYQYHHESVFTPVHIDSLQASSDLPSTLTSGRFYVSIGEADNSGCTKAELKSGHVPNSLMMAFVRDSVVIASKTFISPWRTVSFSNTATGLHEFSELSFKLSPASVSEKTDWIVPGKLIRSQLNTQAGLDCIDFAKKMNFKYIMFDAGWYGPERSVSSDPAVPIPQIDMPGVIRYGREHGIGVILYVNYIGLQKHLDKILPLYKKWGVSGMKFGFIDGISQKGIIWLVSAIKKVNDAGLLLNVHDNYKPTGLSRTYPAFLTQEGIRGDENSPDAYHNTVLPYTRFLAGAGDFTFCFPNSKNGFSKNIKVSKAQQLALTVVYFSPIQAMFWYGQPKDYTDTGEIEFFALVPTVWNETRYLKGEIGENISVARRSGDTWFIGSATGFNAWKEDLMLDFLVKGKTYTATIYEDGPQDAIVKREKRVRKGDVLPINLLAKGGMAVMIKPEK